MISKQFYDGDDRAKRARKPRRNTGWERQRAVRVVAAMATDAEECAELLAVLGLNAVEGQDAAPSPRASGSTTQRGSAA